MIKAVFKVTCIFFLFCILLYFPPFYESVHAGGETPSSGSQQHAIVKEIRYWSGSTHTRIVIDLDQEVAYKDHLLKRDDTLQKPPRLYIDLTVAKLSPHLNDPIPIESGLLKSVRAGQYNPDSVRVVLDLESVTAYKVFPLNDPFRVVIDVMGTAPVHATKQEEAIAAAEPPPRHPQPQQPQSVTIVIDAGHGGTDPGAIGPTGLKEKDVVLKISKKVRDTIKKKLGWKIVMTRDDDRFIPLDERTAIANSKNATLFLSIHANACTDRRICGIESYVLGTTTNKDALRLAAKENNISTKQVSDLQVILADLKLNDPQKVIPSSNLADCVQRSLVKNIHNHYGQVRDLGVKQAPFVVLIGAEMPSILVEVSFISNPREEKRLRDSRYLDTLADAIVEGLKQYAHDAKMVKGQVPSVSASMALNSN
jgi:N-acetylmuramoyl-L-alanine amidase